MAFVEVLEVLSEFVQEGDVVALIDDKKLRGVGEVKMLEGKVLIVELVCGCVLEWEGRAYLYQLHVDDDLCRAVKVPSSCAESN